MWTGPKATAIVWITWIGLHADYDTIDVKKVPHGK
jgi:hypothetical protein